MARNAGKSHGKPKANADAATESPAPPSVPAVQGGKSWHLALLLLVLSAPFAGILVMPDGRVLGHPITDGATAYYHFGYFAGQAWKSGIVPLWNPHIMLGIPFLAEGQASIFHPLSFLFVFLRASVAVNWIVAISFVLTGLFFYGYLRALNLGRAASWCGAITWSFSSAMVSRIYPGHLNILLTFISIPMILMLWERYRAGGGRRHLAGIAFGYGLMILAFYPQFLYIFSLFFLLYVLIQSGLAILDGSSTARREGQAIFALGTYILLGIGAGAVQLLPALDFLGQSFRQTANIHFCGSFSFPPENLLTLLAPHFAGFTLTETTSRYWGRSLFWEMWIYLGMLPLILAVAGAGAAPRRRSVALLACGGIFLIIGLGKYTPLFPLIYEYIPLFDVFRGPSKNTLITLFCLVTLSAYGFEALFSNANEPRQQRLRRIALTAAVTLMVIAGALMVFLVRNGDAPGSNWDQFIQWVWSSKERLMPVATSDHQAFLKESMTGATNALIRSMIFLWLSLAVLLWPMTARRAKHRIAAAILIVLVDLLGVFHPMMRTFDKADVHKPLALEESARPPYLPRLLVALNPVPNLAMRSGYSTPFGYTGNTLKRYNDLISALQMLNPNESRADSKFIHFTPQFDMLAFDGVAVTDEDVLPGAKPVGNLGDKIILPYGGKPINIPRAYLAAEPVYFSYSQDVMAYLLSEKVNLLAKPAIERRAGILPPQPLESGELVSFISYEPNRVELEARANYSRELILNEMFEKNWRATISGVPVSIEPANYAFRAVQVPAGTSRVVFEYKPRAFYIGAVATGVSLAILLAIFVRDARLNSPRRKTTGTSAETVQQ